MDIWDKILKVGAECLIESSKGECFVHKATLFNENDDIKEWYFNNFGAIINTDCAKLAFIKDGYAPNNSELVRKFHLKSSELVSAFINDFLNSAHKQSTLILMAGGNGSGKSTFCSKLKDIIPTNYLIIDATFASYDAAKDTIQQALAKDINIKIIYIKREKGKAWYEGVIKRTKNGGHLTPKDIFDYTHRIVPENIEKISALYKDKINIIEIENDNWRAMKI